MNLAQFRSIHLTPLTPHMGAEVRGCDLNSLTEQQHEEIQAAFLLCKVLAFRDQNLTRDAHKAFGRRFGTLHVHPSKRQRGGLGGKGDPEIFAIRTTPDSRFANGEIWHTDVSCDEVPPKASLLYVKTLPEGGGGDTLFANMTAVFEALSEPLKTWLRTLTARHDGRKDLANYGIELSPGQSYPAATHPVVPHHPDTGEEVLFVNRAFTDRIVELSRAESDALLELLWRQAEDNPRFQCRVRWQPGTLTMWDNRNTWHHAVWDYFPNSRYSERVTVAGERAPSRRE